MIKNRKGIMFTIMAVIMAAFLTTIFTAQEQSRLSSRVEITEARITVLSEYMRGFYFYAGKTGSISGYSAFQGIINEMSVSNSYTDLFEEKYLYCLETGNLTINKECFGMQEKSLKYYLDSMVLLAKQDLNINSSYYINNITLGSERAFSLNLIINLSLNITDYYANLSKTGIIISTVIFEGLQDPLHLLNATYNRTIKQYPVNKDGDWNHTDLQLMYQNNYYRIHPEGISFINRIKGNFIPSIYGIESIINYTNPTVNYNVNHSLIDHLFLLNITFNCSENPPMIIIVNKSIMPAKQEGGPYFQLDTRHANSFNIKSSDREPTC